MYTTFSTEAGTAAPRENQADVADIRLALALAADDENEDHGLNLHERTTCHLHRRSLHDCVSTPLHAIAVTRPPLGRTVRVRGERCAAPAAGKLLPAQPNRQLVRACRASLAAAGEGKYAAAPWTRNTTNQ